MRNKILIFIMLSAAVISCKKSSPAPDPTIIGFWKGKNSGNINTDTSTYIFSMAALIRNNGTVRIYFDPNSSRSLDTSSPVGTYEGAYLFNKNTGSFTATVESTDKSSPTQKCILIASNISSSLNYIPGIATFPRGSVSFYLKK